MKTIGLIGGMSWESSAVYYNIINKKVHEILGGFHCAKSIMVTVEFDEIQRLQHFEDWKALDEIMVKAAKTLEIAGADFVILCTNTMHLCSPAIIRNISIPFLHIAEATGLKIAATGLKKVALLGTKFTMEKDFYKTYIFEKFGIEVIIPAESEREVIHQTIYTELVQGVIKDESRLKFQKIIENLEKQGAEGVILGCTEIPLLVKQNNVKIPVFDTTAIHAEKAVELALQE
jgi:aspartate racemase